ncbi:MAG: ABC transporter substrate-binding protein/permease [Clostridia bacterium]|nr:ABC transporter substrate-binding protein/permease [Clostridia bacterium]
MKSAKKKFFVRKGIILSLCLAALMSVAGCGKYKMVTNVDELEGSRIGVQLGTTGDIYASDYEGDEAGTIIERYNKGNDAVQALKQKKIDAVIIDEEPAKAFVSKNSDLKILDEEFTVEDYAICISKENTELKNQINDALRKLKADGTLDAIIKNYTGSDDEKGKTPYAAKNIARPNGTIIVATNAAFPPYEYYSEGVMTGLDIDMMQAVCDTLGMTLKMEDMEFDSIIAAVQSGKATVGAAGLTVTEDRLKNIDFSDSYTTSKQVIIVKDPDAAASSTNLSEKFKDNFITESRWQYIAKGLGNTLIITLFAILIGCALGFLIAIVRTSYDKNGSMKILNAICRVYLTVIRGTPVMVQLLIIYYVILASVNTSKILVAVIAFGLNSAAYVAEVVRSGIMAVDNGQFEAGRSLGLNYRQTMVSIILPQAVKNILPALGNEFISLLKETSISGYIGLMDLTKGGDIIRSITYEAFMPLIAVALVYLVIVMALSFGVNKLERRLKKNER